MNEYAVLRPAPGFTLPPEDNGKWIDVSTIAKRWGADVTGWGVGTPTGRFETRADGVRAEIYEVSW